MKVIWNSTNSSKGCVRFEAETIQDEQMLLGLLLKHPENPTVVLEINCDSPGLRTKSRDEGISVLITQFCIK